MKAARLRVKKFEKLIVVFITLETDCSIHCFTFTDCGIHLPNNLLQGQYASDMIRREPTKHETHKQLLLLKLPWLLR